VVAGVVVAASVSDDSKEGVLGASASPRRGIRGGRRGRAIGTRRSGWVTVPKKLRVAWERCSVDRKIERWKS